MCLFRWILWRSLPRNGNRNDASASSEQILCRRRDAPDRWYCCTGRGQWHSHVPDPKKTSTAAIALTRLGWDCHWNGPFLSQCNEEKKEMPAQPFLNGLCSTFPESIGEFHSHTLHFSQSLFCLSVFVSMDSLSHICLSMKEKQVTRVATTRLTLDWTFWNRFQNEICLAKSFDQNRWKEYSAFVRPSLPILVDMNSNRS